MEKTVKFKNPKLQALHEAGYEVLCTENADGTKVYGATIEDIRRIRRERQTAQSDPCHTSCTSVQDR